MNYSYFIPMIMLFIILFITQRNERVAIRNIIKLRKIKGTGEMVELAKRFIDKECIIYTFSSQQFDGVIKEVNGNAVVIEKDGTQEVVNLDFVVRIREYPKNINGKKKSFFI